MIGVEFVIVFEKIAELVFRPHGCYRNRVQLKPSFLFDGQLGILYQGCSLLRLRRVFQKSHPLCLCPEKYLGTQIRLSSLGSCKSIRRRNERPALLNEIEKSELCVSYLSPHGDQSASNTLFDDCFRSANHRRIAVCGVFTVCFLVCFTRMRLI